MKFFSCDDSSNLTVTYKIKVPAQVFAFDMSTDGNHFAMGLSDGSLIIKSKLLEEEKAEAKMDEE